jgi:hypothetical protein
MPRSTGTSRPEPYLDIAIPSLLDSSLCPPGRHVLSVHAQWTPYALAAGGERAALGDHLAQVVLDTLERYAPGISGLIEHRQVLTPADLEARYSLTGGHIHHGELSIDQLFAMRPVAGCAQYRTPIRRLFLCGAGTHPGIGMTGASGTERGHRDPEGAEVRRGNVKLTELRTPCVLVDPVGSTATSTACRRSPRPPASGCARTPRHTRARTWPCSRWRAGRSASAAPSSARRRCSRSGSRTSGCRIRSTRSNAERVLALLDRTHLSFIVDHLDVARRWSEVMREAGREVDVLVKVDVGFHRCGIDPHVGAADFVTEVAGLPGLRFKGLLSHAGQAYAAGSEKELAAIADEEARLLVSLRDEVTERGVRVEEISVGATPTARFSAGLPGLTELRPGNYIYYDRMQVGLGAATWDDCALTVLARVVSRPARDRLILDSGSKTLTTDQVRGGGTVRASAPSCARSIRPHPTTG